MKPSHTRIPTAQPNLVPPAIPSPRKESLEAENARLKAEVENSNRINTELLILSNRQASDIRRLTEAGDAMADCITEFRCGKYGNALNAIGGFKVWIEWNAAKEGKPSV